MPTDPAFPEHGRVVVTRDLPGQGLTAGDVGVVIHIDRDDSGERLLDYMLELFSATGATLGVVSVPADAVRAPEATDRLRVVAAE